MKKTLFSVCIALFILSLSGCGGCSNWQSDTSYLDVSNGESGYDDGGYSRSEEPSRQGIHTPVTVEVSGGVSLQEAGKEIYPDLLDWEEQYGFGGVKLCAEMSADQDGKSLSVYNEPTLISFRPPADLYLKKIDCGGGSPDIVSRVVNREITADMGCVQSHYTSIFSFAHFSVDITVCNQTDNPVTVRVPKGQMLEVQAADVQNIVVIETVETELYSRQTKSLTVKAFCASEKRKDPTYHRVKLTPFVLTAPSNAYNSQQSLWDFFRTNTRNTRDSYAEKTYSLTFYAWGSGSVNSRGEKSDFGHAFVFIPGIGTVGYGGTVSDHSQSVQYAQYQISIAVSENALRKAQEKYREWENNPPEYKLMQYDCTTFVMDIADAAGIYYGNGRREGWLQSPAGFIRELKKYNKE